MKFHRYSLFLPKQKTQKQFFPKQPRIENSARNVAHDTSGYYFVVRSILKSHSNHNNSTNYCDISQTFNIRMIEIQRYWSSNVSSKIYWPFCESPTSQLIRNSCWDRKFLGFFDFANFFSNFSTKQKTCYRQCCQINDLR